MLYAGTDDKFFAAKFAYLRTGDYKLRLTISACQESEDFGNIFVKCHVCVRPLVTSYKKLYPIAFEITIGNLHSPFHRCPVINTQLDVFIMSQCLNSIIPHAYNSPASSLALNLLVKW